MKNNNNQKEKSFGRLAYERLISNLLSVKVWLFLIPITLSVFYLHWTIDLIMNTFDIVLNNLNDQNQMTKIATEGMISIRDLFSSWLKFTGSLVVSVIGVREIWKINKIKEETKRNNINQVIEDEKD
jgi:hypothetical protein